MGSKFYKTSNITPIPQGLVSKVVRTLRQLISKAMQFMQPTISGTYRPITWILGPLGLPNLKPKARTRNRKTSK